MSGVAGVPEDVRRRLAEHHRGKDLARALQLVDALAAAPRVVRSVVFLAAGRLDRLEHYCECAARDWRDVVFWAEYEEHDAHKPRLVRSMTEPFGDS